MTDIEERREELAILLALFEDYDGLQVSSDTNCHSASTWGIQYTVHMPCGLALDIQEQDDGVFHAYIDTEDIQGGLLSGSAYIDTDESPAALVHRAMLFVNEQAQRLMYTAQDVLLDTVAIGGDYAF